LEVSKNKLICLTIILNYYPWNLILCEIMVKGARGTKVKVIFQELHMTHGIFGLVYNLKFCISPNWTLDFRYKYILITNWLYIMTYIMHSCLLSYIYGQLLIRPHFFKSIIFRVKNTFEPNVFKWVIKKNPFVQVFFPF
jgi:hypothetical protein